MSESNHNDDVLFDRNDGNNRNNGNEQLVIPSVIDQLRKVINEMQNNGYTPEIYDARKRVANKLLEIMTIQRDISRLERQSIIENVDVIDEDMFNVGTIEGNMLVIDIPPID